GAIYGVFDLVEKMGVSPWHFWADVPVRTHESIYVRGDLRLSDAPVVRYRGFFLNNEAPALTNWAHANFGQYNHEFYVHVFDLLQRLKANYLWPVMWNNSFNHDDPRNMVLAHEYGIVMGTSHHEPMMRADKEWDVFGEGPWQYSTNAANLDRFWRGGVERNKPFDSLITLGMRGREDTAMSEGKNIALLEEIVANQREIIAEVHERPAEEVPQVWTLYKEVQGFYERGMRVPDDVILLWTNDNRGNVRRLPTPEERKRPGGAGMYYHFDYVGGPRSWRGHNAMPLAKMWEQMHLTYRYGADKVWIVNVGGLKFHEFPLEFFLRMAWNPERWPETRLEEFGRLWAAREFPAEYAAEIEDLVTAYARHNGRRTAELQAPETYSLLNYDEAERILAELEEMVTRVDALRAAMPETYLTAFHQLVWHPVRFAANITRLNIAVGRNRLYAAQGRAYANEYAEQAREYFAFDAELRNRFDALNEGKWRHMTDQPHIGYLHWQSPQGNQLPALALYEPGNYGEMGVAVEGFATAWPSHPQGTSPRQGGYALRFDSFGEEARELRVFNRGTQPFAFNATASEPWIRLSHPEGEVTREQVITVSIDWDALPDGPARGSIEIAGPGYSRPHIAVHATKPAADLREQARGFLEADGYVSIEAPHYDRNVARNGYAWREIPDHGRTLASMSPFPVTDHSFEDPAEAPFLEYEVTFFSTGTFELQALLAPSWPFMPGRGLRYAVSIGDAPPQIIDLTADFHNEDAVWEQRVRDGVAISRSYHTVNEAGPTTLRVYMIDPGATLQKLLIDTGELLPSYLGPEQSPQR
ncbi:MAG: glycosyl hydrolase 115 family protein, partial [Opitutales bacterium]